MKSFYEQLWSILLIGGIETFLFTRYQIHGSQIHFFIHSFAAVAVVFVLATILFFKKHVLQPLTLLYTAFLLHQYAMFPDYLYSLGYPHHPWMNLFLGHLWLDNLKYHEIIVPIAACVAVALYLNRDFLRSRFR